MTVATEERDEEPRPWSWLPRPKKWEVVGLVLSLMFLAGAAGYAVGIDRRPSAGSADVGFLRDMIYHHQQGLQMASSVSHSATEPVVRGFAIEIVGSQSYEVGLMEAYLRRWGYEREGTESAMAWMGVPVPRDEMPGMASELQLRALREAQGRDVDSLFIALMREHHRGGVDMASAADRLADDGEVRALAARISHNQRIEINELDRARQRLGL